MVGCRGIAHFDAEMRRICDHVEEIITNFGGTYALVAWLSSDRQIKTCATMNLGLQLCGGLGELQSVFIKKAEVLFAKKIFALIPVHERTIWGSGRCDSTRDNSKGWWNKKTSIKGKLLSLGKRGYRLPAIVLVVSNKSTLTEFFPSKDKDMSQLVRDLAFQYHHKGVRVNEDGIPRTPPTNVNMAQNRQIKRRRRFDLFSRRRRLSSQPEQDGERIDGTVSYHAEGTLEWYSHQMRCIHSVPVTPLYKTDTSFHWAAMDARPYGSGLTLHHNMFVEVEATEGPDWHLSCSCDIYRHCVRDPCCVHVEYVRLHLETLQNMPFGPKGEAVPLHRTDLEAVGYYVDGCFVRKQAQKGYRCDVDQSYTCKHVYKVCDTFGLDAGPAAREEASPGTCDATTDESEDDDGAGCLPTNAWIATNSQKVSISHPLEDNIVEAMETVARHGFGPDPEHPSLWCGDVLVPQIPEGECECGLKYSTSGISEYSEEVTVYLNMPHYARRMLCKLLYCPLRNHACTRHYIGLDDGLFRISKTQIVELHILVDSALSLVRFGGVSLTAQCKRLKEMYSSAKVRGKSEAEFLDVNTFRSAVIDVASRITTDVQRFQDSFSEAQEQDQGCVNTMLCPICKDAPEVIIMDGTSMTINSSSCHAPSFTSTWGNDVIKRHHNMIARSYFNVGNSNGITRTKRDRQRVIKLLQEFERWVAPSSEPKPPFIHFEELRSLSARWNLHGLVGWVHKQCTETDLSNASRSSIKAMLHEISTQSPTTSYLNYASASMLLPCLEDKVLPVPVLESLGPFLRGLFNVVRKPADGFVRIPDSWVPFLREIITRSRYIHDVPRMSGEQELGQRIQYPRPPSITTNDYMESGICCGLRRVRHRPKYECDDIKSEKEYTEKDKLPCKHNFYKPGKRTGGVFTCMCQHGIAYASFIIKEAEGRNEPFTFLTCFLETAPRVVIYDFACSLMDYCLNRAPTYFRDTLFFVDVFHWVNHVACARSFSIRAYSEYKDIVMRTQNSEACEQINAAMKRLRFVLSRMGQRAFMVFLRLFLANWNVGKLEKVSNLQRHGDTARVGQS